MQWFRQVFALSKSSKRRQASAEQHHGLAKDDSNRITWIIVGVVVVCIFIAGIWLFMNRTVNDPIVGTWTDNNNYWAYAYYSNGSILEMGWYMHKTGDSVSYVPVFINGTWTALGNGHYSVIPDSGQNATTYETVISGNNMTVLNMSSSATHKISDVPDVNLLDFKYIT